MVDVGIGFLQTPDSWVCGKGSFHILMHKFLEIDLGCIAQRSNHDIRTNPLLNGQVTIGIRQTNVRGIITYCFPDLAAGGRNDW